MATDYSTEEIFNIWEGGDKDTADLFKLVKGLDLDRDVDPTDWLKENLRKKGEEGKAFREYHPEWYKSRLKEYYDTQDKLHKVKKVEDLATGKTYSKQPGTRGASTSDLWYSKSRDAAHKAQMKIKDANKAKKLKEEEDSKNLSIWGKMGKHFSENADSRDKLFNYMTSVGRELVKPIEPGKQAAGALIPTLVRGMEAGEKKYAAEKLAETEMLLKRSEAAQKANPLQYYTSKMKELRSQAWAADIDPNTAEGIAWMGQQLSQIGINEGAAQLSAAIKDAQDALIMITDPDRKKEQQKLIDQLNGQLLGVITQGLDGGALGTTVPYMPQG